MESEGISPFKPSKAGKASHSRMEVEGSPVTAETLNFLQLLNNHIPSIYLVLAPSQHVEQMLSLLARTVKTDFLQVSLLELQQENWGKEAFLIEASILAKSLGLRYGEHSI